jgi:hypothetical protein
MADSLAAAPFGFERHAYPPDQRIDHEHPKSTKSFIFRNRQPSNTQKPAISSFESLNPRSGTAGWERAGGQIGPTSRQFGMQILRGWHFFADTKG